MPRFLRKWGLGFNNKWEGDAMNKRELIIGYIGNLIVFGILEAGFGLLILVALDYIGILLPHAVLLVSGILLSINLGAWLLTSIEVMPDWLSTARGYFERLPAAVAAKFPAFGRARTVRRARRRTRTSAVHSFVYEVKS
jgi:hypothetical protein